MELLSILSSGGTIFKHFTVGPVQKFREQLYAEMIMKHRQVNFCYTFVGSNGLCKISFQHDKNNG